MKNSQLLLITLTAFALTFISCGQSHEHSHDHEHSHNSDAKTEQTIDKTSKEYASAYICPMHCKGSGSDAPGKCPVCEMDYVENPDQHAHEHSHKHEGDHSHENGETDETHAHDHDDHEGHTH